MTIDDDQMIRQLSFQSMVQNSQTYVIFLDSSVKFKKKPLVIHHWWHNKCWIVERRRRSLWSIEMITLLCVSTNTWRSSTFVSIVVCRWWWYNYKDDDYDYDFRLSSTAYIGHIQTKYLVGNNDAPFFSIQWNGIELNWWW